MYGGPRLDFQHIGPRYGIAVKNEEPPRLRRELERARDEHRDQDEQSEGDERCDLSCAGDAAIGAAPFGVRPKFARRCQEPLVRLDPLACDGDSPAPAGASRDPIHRQRHDSQVRP